MPWWGLILLCCLVASGTVAFLLRAWAARRRAEAQSQATQAELEAFAYTVSHDLRAPLRAMSGFSHALLEDFGNALDPTAQEYARRIVTAAGRMDRMLQDLLAYSRLGRMEIRCRPVDLAAVIATAQGVLADEIAAVGAAIAVDAPLPPVRAHEETLADVITHLLRNAVTFVADGVVPHVHCRAERRRRKVRLWIEDNGIGIAREHHERIFRVFDRLHGVERYPGTGVGLALAERAVHRMGGAIGVESTIGKGSRFWIELPGAT